MFSALVIADFAVSVERQQQPDLADRPLILLHGEHQLRALAVDALARDAGARPGDSRRQAAWLCPQATFLHARPEVYRRVFAALTSDLAQQIDKVEPHYQPERACFFVQSGHARELAALRDCLQGRLDAPVSIGTAGGKFVAQAAALSGGGGRAVAAGEAAAFLATFPVALLPLNADMQRRLPMMGIRSIGEFARLGRAAIFEQWGSVGQRCHDLALGRDPRPLQACQPPPTLCASLAFEEPLSDRQQLQAACLQLAQGLLQQLEGRGAGRLALLLQDENQRIHELQLQPGAPLRGLPQLQRQLPQLLEQPDYRCGIRELQLQLSHLTPAPPRQLALFGASRQQRNLQQALGEWQRRFQQVVYRLHLTEAPRHFPPALQYEREAI